MKRSPFLPSIRLVWTPAVVFLPALTPVGLVLGTGCSLPLEAPSMEQRTKTPKGAATRKAVSSAPTAPTTTLVTITDPVEGQYSIGMPKGWANRTYTARVFDIATMVDVTVSPNGSVVIFQGDPSLPIYYSPNGASPVHYEFAKLNKRMRIEPFVPAREYFTAYVNRKFGKLPGFKITGIEGDEAGELKLQRKFAEAGIRSNPTIANVSFSYTDRGTPMRARIMGATIDSGPIWNVGVTGIATSGDPKKYLVMVDAMGKTRKMNPRWQAEQQQKHEARMAQMRAFSEQMTANHNANMAWIQTSAQAHQGRMKAIWARGDASTQAFNQRMAAGDAQQRNFLNYINDESTVVSSSGKTFQVDNSYQRYFMKKSDRTYIGGDSTMDLDSLRRFNLNPDDYEEVKIRK